MSISRPYRLIYRDESGKNVESIIHLNNPPANNEKIDFLIKSKDKEVASLCHCFDIVMQVVDSQGESINLNPRTIPELEIHIIKLGVGCTQMREKLKQYNDLDQKIQEIHQELGALQENLGMLDDERMKLEAISTENRTEEEIERLEELDQEIQDNDHKVNFVYASLKSLLIEKKSKLGNTSKEELESRLARNEQQKKNCLAVRRYLLHRTDTEKLELAADIVAQELQDTEEELRAKIKRMANVQASPVRANIVAPRPRRPVEGVILSSHSGVEEKGARSPLRVNCNMLFHCGRASRQGFPPGPNLEDNVLFEEVKDNPNARSVR